MTMTDNDYNHYFDEAIATVIDVLESHSEIDPLEVVRLIREVLLLPRLDRRDERAVEHMSNAADWIEQWAQQRARP